MYSKVIVPLDGSELAETALPFVRLVAGALPAPIELVEAFDVLPPAVHGRSPSEAFRRMQTEAERQSQRYLSTVQERLRDSGYAATVVTLQGAPEQAIAERAGADPQALVVMSTHGRGGIARWALGSVADKVIHTVPNPVLLTRAVAGRETPADISLESVLVPLDGSNLAELSLPHAVGLANALHAELALVMITPTTDSYRRQLDHPIRRVTSSGDSLREIADELARADADEAERYLSAMQTRLRMEYAASVRVSTRLLHGDDVAQSIIEHAAASRSLVVMTTHGRSGIGRLMLGSITDRVVRHCAAPVLVVREWRELASADVPETALPVAPFGSGPAGVVPA